MRREMSTREEAGRFHATLWCLSHHRSSHPPILPLIAPFILCCEYNCVCDYVRSLQWISTAYQQRTTTPPRFPSVFSSFSHASSLDSCLFW